MMASSKSCVVVAENEPIVEFLRGLESKFATQNPGSKMRFTMKKAISSVAKHHMPIKNGKDARKLAGIGDFLESKIEKFLSLDGKGGGASADGNCDEGSSRGSADATAKQAPAKRKGKATAPTLGGGRAELLPPATSASQQSHSERDDDDDDEYGIGGLVMCSQQQPLVDQYLEPPPQECPMDITPKKRQSVIDLTGYDDTPAQPTGPTIFEPKRVGGASRPPSPQVGGKRKVPSASQQQQHQQLPTCDDGVADGNGLAYFRNLLLKGRDSRVAGGQDGGDDDGNWRVMLLLDARERHDNNLVQSVLLQAGVDCEVRQLSLGDMLWIVKRTRPGAPLLFGKRGPPVVEELVLRYVVERKTSADLAASIIDGRFVEQKHRLHKSALDRVFYLVEGSLSHQDTLGTQALRSALCTSQVIHGMSIVTTGSLDQTAAHLRRMHQWIVGAMHRFMKDIEGESESWSHSLKCPFATRVLTFTQFQELSRKPTSLAVKALFGRQLRQIQGCSPTIVMAILDRYPTPTSLSAALEGLDEKSGMALLHCIPIPAGKSRGIGPAISKVLYHTYCRSPC